VYAARFFEAPLKRDQFWPSDSTLLLYIDENRLLSVYRVSHFRRQQQWREDGWKGFRHARDSAAGHQDEVSGS
jgi:hypothetical protein